MRALFTPCDRCTVSITRKQFTLSYPVNAIRVLVLCVVHFDAPPLLQGEGSAVRIQRTTGCLVHEELSGDLFVKETHAFDRVSWLHLEGAARIHPAQGRSMKRCSYSYMAPTNDVRVVATRCYSEGILFNTKNECERYGAHTTRSFSTASCCDAALKVAAASRPRCV